MLVVSEANIGVASTGSMPAFSPDGRVPTSLMTKMH